ncbi:MAG TPA: DUF58 domain-containing protein [Polyangiaceae bacterium]|nr:DUF58 domain-containing protein [Polyangiaceae bacterium]
MASPKLANQYPTTPVPLSGGAGARVTPSPVPADGPQSEPPSTRANREPPPSVPPSEPRAEGKSFFARSFGRLRPPRKLKLTREGKYFIGVTFGVGFAAINTGNNLLYLLLGMLLSLIIVSGVMSELSLRDLSVVRRLPPRAQVGRPHLVEIEVYNHKQRVPSYAIEIEDLRAGQPADKRCFFLKISPRSTQVAAYRRTPARRGRDRHIGFRVATRFPFGLFEKSREISAEGDLIIYPAVDPVTLPQEPRGDRALGNAALGRGSGDEVLGVRPMREGDDPRDIYWRKSTHPQHFVLRERGRETRRDITFQIESTFTGTALPSEEWTARFERRIRDIASRSVAHLKRGDWVTLRTSAGERARSSHAQGADPLLRFLALLEARPEPPRVEPTRAEANRAVAERAGLGQAALGQAALGQAGERRS